MKTIAISGSARQNVGKRDAKNLRYEGKVPAVLYGGTEQYHFAVLEADLRDLVYTPNIHFVDLSIDGLTKKGILQEVQFHPLTDRIVHIDFLELFEDKNIAMNVPIKLVGTSPGVRLGGKLLQKLRTIRVKALPSNMPQHIEVNLETLEVGQSVRVSDLSTNNYQIVSSLVDTIVSVSMSRAMKQAADK